MGFKKIKIKYNSFKNVSYCNFISLVFRKFISIFFYKFRFNKCNDLYVGKGFQTNGLKNIYIDKLTCGKNMRLEALSYHVGVLFTPKIEIGKNVSFGDNCHVASVLSIYIGNNCLFGSGVYISDHDHGDYTNSICSSPQTSPAQRSLSSSPIKIGNNVYVGEYSVILKGVSIGNGSIIGAHSVVTKDVPLNSIVAGNPAKVIKIFNIHTNKWENIS